MSHLSRTHSDRSVWTLSFLSLFSLETPCFFPCEELLDRPFSQPIPGILGARWGKKNPCFLVVCLAFPPPRELGGEKKSLFLGSLPCLPPPTQKKKKEMKHRGFTKKSRRDDPYVPGTRPQSSPRLPRRTLTTKLLYWATQTILSLVELPNFFTGTFQHFHGQIRINRRC